MGDNAPQGHGRERNEGLEIKSRPRESHSESAGNAPHRVRHNRKTSCVEEEKEHLGDIFCPLDTVTSSFYKVEAYSWFYSGIRATTNSFIS